MRKVFGWARRIRPHIVDRWTLVIVAVAFGTAVCLIAWHGTSLRLEADGAVMGWAVLVAFGMTWHGEWSNAWRVGAGVVFGALAATAAWYGVLSVLPVTALGFGIGLGIAAFAVAAITHVVPRALSFAGAAVGFGVGVAASRAFPMRPTTPADDLFALMLTTSLAIVIGSFGSMMLRASIVWLGVHQPRAVSVIRFPRHRSHPVEPEMDVTTEIVADSPLQSNGKRRKAAPRVAPADAPTKRMKAAR